MVEAAVLQDGILHLRQGLDFHADAEVIVFLFQAEGTIPENASWTLEAAASGFDRPHIHVTSKGDGNDSIHDVAIEGYSMRLELGAEQGKRIPGKIWLCTEAKPDDRGPALPPASRRTWVAGTFTATVRGFILRDGLADCTEDSLRLIPWLAGEQLRRQHLGKPVAITSSTCEVMSTGQRGSWATGDVEWSLEGRPQGWIRVRCVKTDGAWTFDRFTPADQISDAHPEMVPDPRGGADTVKYLAAVELERRHAGKIVHLEGGLSPQVKDGVAAACRASLKLAGGDDGVTCTLLFRWTDTGWAFERDLAEGERFDSGTGEVRKQPGVHAAAGSARRAGPNR